MPGGVSLLTAKKSVGKSTFLRNLCAALAEGRSEFLGRPIRQCRVLYFPFEGGGVPVLTGFERLGIDPDNPHLRVEIDIPFHHPNLDARIAWMKERILANGAEFVVVDTLGRFDQIGGNDAYGSTTMLVGALEKLALETGCHILYSTHTGKNRSDDAELTGAALGSAGLESAAQAHVHLRKRGKGIVTVEIGDMRLGTAMPETLLAYNEENDSVDIGEVWTGRNAAILQQYQDRTLEFLRGASPDDYFSAKDIAADFELKSPRWISWALSELERAASPPLDREGKGKRGSPYKYRIKQDGGNASDMDPPPQKKPNAQGRLGLARPRKVAGEPDQLDEHGIEKWK